VIYTNPISNSEEFVYSDVGIRSCFKDINQWKELSNVFRMLVAGFPGQHIQDGLVAIKEWKISAMVAAEGGTDQTRL
jgi:hypothetical protein